MTYGWLISNPNGIRIVNGYGCCSAERASSFRAEVAGILAASIFLGMQQKYTNFNFQKLTVKFMADNDGLICKEVEHLVFTPDPYPGSRI